MKIKISQAMKDHAKWAEEELIKAHPRPTYTKLQAPNANYFGVLGELAFVFALYHLGKRGVYKPQYNGISDHGDVFVKTRAEWVPLDVKTASKPSHKHLMTPKVQYDKPGDDMVYVGLRLQGDIAEVLGFAYKRDLKPADATMKRRLGLKIETMYIELDKLRPTKQMMDRLEEGKFTFKVPSQEKLV